MISALKGAYNGLAINRKEVNTMAEKDKQLADSLAKVASTLPAREQGYLLGYAECLAAQSVQARLPGGERQDSA